jgi:predicted TIM-barrel fold metal-dependent hydrolase
VSKTVPMAIASGWDCHAHLFGPYVDFPLAADRSYSPPEATLESYQIHLAQLGLTRGVLVHPSAYANDHRLLFSVLREEPLLRGVAVANKNDFAKIIKDKPEGLRAMRFSHRSGPGANFFGSALLNDLTAIAPDLADAGMHAELWTDCLALPDISAALKALPVPIVIDHMGGFDVHLGTKAPGFVQLLKLVESGKVWVKLCAYRNLLNGGNFDEAALEAGRPFQQALIDANPNQLLWGSDWPHLRVSPRPEAKQLLNFFKDWIGSDTLTQTILHHNPQRLYG